MKRTIIAVSAVLLIAVLAVPFVFAPKDEELIRTALNNAVQASEEGRPGGVLDNLSSYFKVNSESIDRGSVSEYVKLAKPEIKVLDPTPTIAGDRATVISPVVVTMRLGPMETPTRLERVEIQFAKETGRKFLVLPAPVWRISGVRVSEADKASFEN